MSVYLNPVGLAAAPVNNQLSVLAVFKERLCQPYCGNSDLSTQIGVTYTAGTPTLVGTTVFVPITASVSVLSPGCGCASVPQGFTERFEVAFQGRTALPTAVTITSVGRTQQPTCISKNGKVNGISIFDSLTIAIA